MVIRAWLAGSLVALTLALPGCSSVELAAPQHRLRLGPAAAHPVRRILAAPATCGSLTMVRVETGDPEHPRWEPRRSCAAQAQRAVDQAIRAGLEFGGFNVIDSEKVNAVTASRQEILLRQEQRERKLAEVEGALFGDATPAEQDSILAELGAQGLLSARIFIGAGVGAGERRVAMVQLQLVEVPSRALVWARRCELEVGGLLATDELAMQRAARCAVEGIRAP